MAYDDSNIFAKILRSELPCSKIHETDQALAFHDINPQAPVHALVIPKGPYVSMDDFSEKASAEEIAALMRATGQIARDIGVAQAGYRLLANTGENGGQEVPHLHFHLFAGRSLGPMLAQ